jgi:hypothetical protein
VNFLLETKWTYSGRKHIKFSVFSLYLSIFLTVIFRVSFRDFIKFKEWTSWWEIMNFLDAKNIGILIEFLNIKLWTFFKCIQIELHSKKKYKNCPNLSFFRVYCSLFKYKATRLSFFRVYCSSIPAQYQFTLNNELQVSY